ncbi:MAG: porin [Acetobacteraceae bacterium]
MRKLLLATAAMMGASVGMASHAFAQVQNDTSGDSVVTLSDSSGQSASDSTDGQAMQSPGTVTVRLNGRYRFYVGVQSYGAGRTSNFTGASAATAGTGAGAVANSNQGINKLANYGTMQYARLYPGFDGVAANGLKYGASLEIREEGNAGAGGGVFGSVSGAERSTAAPYFRRQFGYLGTDQLGTLRVGSSDGVSSLFLIGSFENFDGGGWDGDIPEMLPGSNVLNWAFTDAGGGYTTEKIVYLSPQFYGFDFGVDWEPTTENGGQGSGACGGYEFASGNIISAGSGVASPGCNELSASSTSDQKRRRNEVEAAIRYRGTFGPVGLATSLALNHSAHVLYDGVPSTTHVQTFQDLNYGQFGLTATYAGLMVGGVIKMGDFDGAPDNLSPSGAKMSTAWVAGASYTIGPVIMGASWFDYIHPNGVAPSLTVGSLREQGAAAGATYSLAPGVSLIASYLWGQQKQNGVNLQQNVVNSAGGFSATQNNKVHEQVFAVGTSFAW